MIPSTEVHHFVSFFQLLHCNVKTFPLCLLLPFHFFIPVMQTVWHEFTKTFEGCTMWSNIYPNYDPYVFPQVWADIPLKGVVTIPKHNTLRIRIEKTNVLELLASVSDGRNSLALLYTVLILTKIKGRDSGYPHWQAHPQFKLYIPSQ